MQVKDSSVDIWGLQLPMQKVLKAADIIWKQCGQELVITSARDSLHSAGSLHYYGLAVDLRSRYFSDITKGTVCMRLRETLGNDYDVICHTTHLHVEYQPKDKK